MANVNANQDLLGTSVKYVRMVLYQHRMDVPTDRLSIQNLEHVDQVLVILDRPASMVIACVTSTAGILFITLSLCVAMMETRIDLNVN